MTIAGRFDNERVDFVPNFAALLGSLNFEFRTIGRIILRSIGLETLALPIPLTLSRTFSSLPFDFIRITRAFPPIKFLRPKSGDFNFGKSGDY